MTRRPRRRTAIALAAAAVLATAASPREAGAGCADAAAGIIRSMRDAERAPTVAHAAEGAPARARADTMAAGAALLDAGKNDEAAGFFLRGIRRHPDRLELAEGLVDALSRGCEYGRAASLLSSIAGDTPLLRIYLDACELRHERRFEPSALEFRAAAIAAAGAGDGISAFVCWRAAARALAGARDAVGAMIVLGRADSLLAVLATREPGVAALAPALAADLRTTAGEAWDLVDRLDEADSLFGLALETAEETGLARVRAAALAGRARVREKRQRAAEAAALYREALGIERGLGDRRLVAALLNNIGQTAIRIGDHESGRARLEESLDIARECDLDWMLGYIQYGLGAIAEAAGDGAAAIARFREATDRHRAAEYTWGEYGARMRLAYNLAMVGEYEEAVTHYEACRAHYEEIHSLYGLSWTLGGLALASHRLGDFPAAERQYRAALDVKRRLGDRAGAAWALNSLGMVYDLQGRYTEALSVEHEAMRIYEEIGDTRGVGAVHFSMGSVRFYLGDYNEALDHYERARVAALETGDGDLLRRVMSGLGSVYSAAGRSDLAGPMYERHLDAVRETDDRVGLLYALVNLASHLVETGRPGEARARLDEADLLLPERGNEFIRARILMLRARTTTDTNRGIALAEQALELAREAGIRELEWRILTSLGDLHLAAGDTARALERQEEAVGAVETLARDVTAAELRTHLLRQAIRPYERAIALRLAGDDDLAAFLLAERSRAQALYAMLRRAFTRAPAAAAAAENAERPVRARLASVQARLQEPGLHETERQTLLAAIDSLELQLEGIRLAAPAGRDLFAAAAPGGIDAGSLLDVLRPGERAFSFMLGPEASWLFTATRDGVTAHRLPPRREIEKRVAMFLGLFGGAGAVPLPSEAVEAAEEELFRLLVAPAGDVPAPGERLVVIPDGALHRLPFALLRRNGRRLADDHEIFYAPSIRVLGVLRNRAHGRSGAYRMLAVGNGGATGSGRVYPFTNVPVEPLPHADEEAAAVAAMFEPSLALVGAEAGEKQLETALRRGATMLHIAAHSAVDDADPRRSFIVLASERFDSTSTASADGILQWHEIASLPADASLVTLSACRSAAGVVAAGEGVMGITQAFLQAGATCVLASRVDVPDGYARRFMQAFYRRLRDGAGAAAALKAARLDLATAETAPADRALWSGFVLVGDGTVAPGAAPALSPLLLIFLVALAAGLFFLVVRRRLF